MTYFKSVIKKKAAFDKIWVHLCNSDDLSEIELPEDLDEVHNIMITEIKDRVESTYKIKPNQYQIIRQ